MPAAPPTALVPALPALVPALLPALLLCGCQLPASVLGKPAAPDRSAFWATWGDGRAEVSAYGLTQPRYGQPRDGTAVMITVTEDFSWSERVKADPGQHPEADIRKVIKLNQSREFQTGVYPYRIMTSVFARVDAGDGMEAMEPIKITFSAQEWCGMVFDQLLLHPRGQGLRAAVSGYTYFDGDDWPRGDLDLPPGALLGDALPLWIRGLHGPILAVGEEIERPFLPSRMELRFAHRTPAVGALQIRRDADATREILASPVPAPPGTPGAPDPAAPPHPHPRLAYGAPSVLPAEVYVTVQSGPDLPAPIETTWWVEPATRRLLGWASSSGESADLNGSDRLPYWAMNQPGGEAALPGLGL